LLCMWARASLFRPLTNTNVYGTGFVKIWKNRHNIGEYTDIFYSVAFVTATYDCFPELVDSLS